MKLNQTLAKELDLTYWSLKSRKLELEGKQDSSHHSHTDGQNPPQVRSLTAEEQTLLEKILSSVKQVFQPQNLQLTETAVIYKVGSKKLEFKDVEKPDSFDTIYLADLNAMSQNSELKRKTWHKLKKEFL